MSNNPFFKWMIFIASFGVLVSCQIPNSGKSAESDTNNSASSHKIAVSDTLATILQYIESPNAPNNWSQRFSPDGNWYIKNNILGDHLTGFEGFSIRNPQTGFKTDGDFGLALGKYQSLGNWATDSSAFTVIAVDEPGPRCPYNQVIIYNREDSHRFSPNIFEPDTNGICVQPSWSPDNAMVAVTVMTDPRSIFLIDRQANLEHKLDLMWGRPPPERISPVQWIDDMLIYSVEYPYDENGHSLNELRIMDLTTSEQQILLSGYGTYFAVVGVEQGRTRILIHETNENSKHELFNLHVYDLVERKIEQSIQVAGRLQNSTQLLSLYPAFQIETEYLSTEYHLWLFDWQTLEIIDYGQITGLVTWLPQEEGFLVVQSNDESSYYFEIIQP